ncbi:hypothetical protein B0T16DRAFT_315181 [Cercophora newfieldiana]|uniref:DUF1750-domain-containing protein n=1 Tax=Cercophora newfieldiana TaxID=92897 RepID=A0AA40CZT0_9PEZI|nr:hypothetical protein B0T16DRAFT_315181 [Cercophora newfieldiana]
MAAADPSSNVHGDLLPHVHLLSTYRYALMPRVELQDVQKWLMLAPKIARDTAPFFWTYLDCPQDGSIFLTWQPTARRNLDFASDGYVWTSPETYYRNEIGNGLALDIWYQRAGYRPGEQFAIHSRRRFRLVPSQVQGGNIPQVDPNLWLVHYGPSEKQDRLPVTMLPVTAVMQQTMSIRQQLFQMGQIARKEFMLSDRINWPHVPLPARGQNIYPPPMPNRNVPQAMAYPPHPGHGAPAVGPTPKRRGGHAQGAAHPPQMMGAPFPGMDSIFDDDEDISRGDMFDHLTPQEMSMHRYRQNHEWMEEILSSPYRIGQLEVADLGLGRRGELASLTDGVFESQGNGNWELGPKKPYTGHLDPEIAKMFKARVEERSAAHKAEIAKMKEEHEKMLASLSGLATIKQAEQDLRFATEETGSEFWRLEGRLEDSDEGMNRLSLYQNKKVDDILARVEEAVGRRAAVVRDVCRVQEGGYQEPAPEPEPEPVQQPAVDPGLSAPSASMSRQPSHAGSQNSGVMIGDSDIDMGGTAAGLLDQMHGGFSSTSTPINSFPTPQPHLSAIPSSAATPANLNIPSPAPVPAPTSQPLPSAGDDVKMDEADATRASATASDQGTGSGDWVVVPKGGGSPASFGNPSAPAGSTDPGASTLGDGSAAQLAASSKAPSAAQTPADGIGFDSNDFSSLGDLDTAREALEGYDPPSVDPSGALDVDDLMHGSQFDNAYHDDGQSAGGTPHDGM